jgi:hypothetical protein
VLYGLCGLWGMWVMWVVCGLYILCVYIILYRICVINNTCYIIWAIQYGLYNMGYMRTCFLPRVEPDSSATPPRSTSCGREEEISVADT